MANKLDIRRLYLLGELGIPAHLEDLPLDGSSHQNSTPFLEHSVVCLQAFGDAWLQFGGPTVTASVGEGYFLAANSEIRVALNERTTHVAVFGSSGAVRVYLLT